MRRLERKSFVNLVQMKKLAHRIIDASRTHPCGIQLMRTFTVDRAFIATVVFIPFVNFAGNFRNRHLRHVADGPGQRCVQISQYDLGGDH